MRTTLPSARIPSTGVWPVSTPISPSRVLAMTLSASPAQTSPSGMTSSTCKVTVPPCVRPARRQPRVRSSRPLQLPGLALHVLDAAAHEEGLLGDVVVLSLADRLEGGDRVVQLHERAFLAGELLGDIHRVRQEPLNPPRPVDRDLVVLGQRVNAEDRDDVL